MRSIIIRMTVFMIIGIVLAALMSEVTFLLLKRDQDRAPETIVLTIPAGTADMVANGQTPPTIPNDLEFVMGDVLEIRNEDNVDHQLGALLIPAGATSSLAFEEVQDFAFACSFTPDKYLGLSVREPLTWSTRIIGIMSAGMPLGLLMGLYSMFAISPARKQEKQNRTT